MPHSLKAFLREVEELPPIQKAVLQKEASAIYDVVTSPPSEAQRPWRERSVCLAALWAITWFANLKLRTFILPSQKANCIPPADVYFISCGDESKEVDWVFPIARKVLEQKQLAIVHLRINSSGNLAAYECSEITTVFLSNADLGAIGVVAFLKVLLRSLTTTYRVRRIIKNLRSRLHMTSWQAGSLFYHMFWRAIWECFLLQILPRNFSPRYAFAASDFYALPRAFLMLARKRGARTGHVLHGFPHEFHFIGGSDFVFCFSSIDRDLGRTLDLKHSHIHSIGHPRSVFIADEVKKLRQTVPAANVTPRLVFFEQPPDRDYDFSCYEQTISLLPSLLALAKQGDIQLRLRVHPRSRNNFLKSALDQSEISPLLSKNSLIEDLAWANFVATGWSTAAIEAVWADCLLLWFPVGTFHFPLREQLIKNNIGLEVANPAALESFLQEIKINTQTFKTLLIKQRSQAEKLNMFFQPTAWERLLDL